jgi:CRISPR-associated endonuclease Csy4
MTQHYVDLGLRGDEETSIADVRDIVFGRLHGMFVRAGGAIGISFPRASVPGAYETHHELGSLIRLHGTDVALKAVLKGDWRTNLSDYVVVSPVSPVPSGARWVRLLRVQAKSSTDRLARRAMKRHGYTEDRARELYGEHIPQRLRVPYLSVRSASTRQSFRLYVRQEPAGAPVDGAFSCYGLSARGGPTVPLF